MPSFYPYWKLIKTPDQMVKECKDKHGDHEKCDPTKLTGPYMNLVVGLGVSTASKKGDMKSLLKYTDKLNTGTDILGNPRYKIGPVTKEKVSLSPIKYMDGENEVDNDKYYFVDNSSASLMGGIIGDIIDMNPISFVGNWPLDPNYATESSDIYKPLDASEPVPTTDLHTYEYKKSSQACKATCKPIDQMIEKIKEYKIKAMEDPDTPGSMLDDYDLSMRQLRGLHNDCLKGGKRITIPEITNMFTGSYFTKTEIDKDGKEVTTKIGDNHRNELTKIITDASISKKNGKYKINSSKNCTKKFSKESIYSDPTKKHFHKTLFGFQNMNNNKDLINVGHHIIVGGVLLYLLHRVFKR